MSPLIRSAAALAALLLAATALTLARAEDRPGDSASSTSPGSIAPSAAGEGDLLAKEFLLTGPEIDLDLVDGALTTLDARGGIYFEMPDLTVIGNHLHYNGVTKLLVVWGTETQPCIVIREGMTTRCPRFEYNTETNEAKIEGRSETELETESGKTRIAGEDVNIRQGEAEGSQVVTIKGGEGGSAQIGSVRPITRITPRATAAPRGGTAPTPAPTPVPTAAPTPPPDDDDDDPDIIIIVTPTPRPPPKPTPRPTPPGARPTIPPKPTMPPAVTPIPRP